MTWMFEDKPITEIPEGFIGFVYLITNNVTGKKYIGKKLFQFSKTTYKTVKLKNGKKKRQRIKSKISSDWLSYYGSNIKLNEDVQTLGSENFSRQILYLCKSKAECSYTEAKLQFEYRVLESDDYYNNNIQCRIHGSHIKSKL